ncbi:YggS family pyridoxal phosphate-dependent enzyme [Enterococcus lemanii]|uniref:Pyridoxal phosphate homeostasis protein n=1 Tax=Enterococcus lemanii TaxID=1159752 RepID=A0ABV9MX39_9ENTE|nr:YggS family pyridoxal phosphate-dependent enzyme [Enterococcus lemanii]MBM7708149.1 pyridoxal phosphate enzyme (YggS family) [Enterococcus lemanii]NLM67064.1 YggS family pyridoxal phosphate-dependent enzyme [Enterococcus sp.]
MISDNLQKVMQEIQNSCALVSRQAAEVELIAVTKSVTTREMLELYHLGVTNFAENRADVLLEKQKELASYPGIIWHFIGNLQRRKVKDIINEIDYFHALDSYKLAKEIQKRAMKKIRCFVEVNVSGEESKHGFQPNEVLAFIQSIQDFDKIEVVGLMMMAPYDSTTEEQIALFTQLAELKETVEKAAYKKAPCHQLSMGMSNDFSQAIQAGATQIRIGTSLFKE